MKKKKMPERAKSNATRFFIQSTALPFLISLFVSFYFPIQIFEKLPVLFIWSLH